MSSSAKGKEMRPLDYLWTGTQVSPVSPQIVNEHTTVRYIHTFDFEESRNFLGPVEQTGMAVVLDGLGPNHPDYTIIGTNPYKIDADEYRHLMIANLKLLARRDGLQITIAAHPKAIEGSRDGYWEPFTVVHGRLVELIANSSVVIDPSGSTALGIAAVMGKPIVLLNSKQFGYRVWFEQFLFSQWLKVPMVSLDKDSRGLPRYRTDPHAYEAYVQRFMRGHYSKAHRSIWETVYLDVSATRPA